VQSTSFASSFEAVAVLFVDEHVAAAPWPVDQHAFVADLAGDGLVGQVGPFAGG
jgi:hypothetical protein